METRATITIVGIRPHYSSAQAIRMLSEEDQLVFRQGLATIVGAERDTLLVGQVSNAGGRLSLNFVVIDAIQACWTFVFLVRWRNSPVRMQARITGG